MRMSRHQIEGSDELISAHDRACAVARYLRRAGYDARAADGDVIVRDAEVCGTFRVWQSAGRAVGHWMGVRVRRARS